MNKLSSGIVELTDSEAMSVCRVGRGAECCAYIVMAEKKFECMRMVADKAVSLTGVPLSEQVARGSMTAKGEGGWEGCIWEGEIEADE